MNDMDPMSFAGVTDDRADANYDIMAASGLLLAEIKAASGRFVTDIKAASGLLVTQTLKQEIVLEQRADDFDMMAASGLLLTATHMQRIPADKNIDDEDESFQGYMSDQSEVMQPDQGVEMSQMTHTQEVTSQVASAQESQALGASATQLSLQTFQESQKVPTPGWNTVNIIE